MRLVATILALALSIPVVAGAATLRVTLRSETELPAGHALKLGQIATIEGEGRALAAGLILGRVPAPGQRRALSRLTIQRALEAAGFERAEIDLGGARQPRVRGLGQPLDGERVREAVRAAIRASSPGSKVRIIDLQLPSNVRLHPGPYDVRISVGRRALRTGINRLSLDIVRADGTTRRLGVYARLEISGPVVIAARDIPRGERILPRDLRLETRAFPSGAPVLSDAADAVGKVARSTLRVGEPLRAASIKKASAVESGQTVVALYRNGSVSLEFETRCRRRGDVGSIVPVVDADGRGIVKARVVAPGRVVILGSDEVSERTSIQEERP